jgi:hypothetical protein
MYNADVWGGFPYRAGQGGVNSINANSLNYGNPTPNTQFDYQGLFGNISEGMNAFSSIVNLYGMFKQLGMQTDAFKFAQEGTKKNFNAGVTAYNENVSSKETSRRAIAADYGQDYDSVYGYGTGQKLEKWT